MVTVSEIVSIGARHDIVSGPEAPRLCYLDKQRRGYELNVKACEHDLAIARQAREWGYLCVIFLAEPDAVLDVKGFFLTRETPPHRGGRYAWRLHTRECDGRLAGVDIPAGESIVCFVEERTGVNLYAVACENAAYETSGYEVGQW